MKPLSDRDMSLFTEEIWLVALFWLNYLEVGGEEVNEDTLTRGIDLLRNMLRPRLTEEALISLSQKENSAGT